MTFLQAVIDKAAGSNDGYSCQTFVKHEENTGEIIWILCMYIYVHKPTWYCYMDDIDENRVYRWYSWYIYIYIDALQIVQTAKSSSGKRCFQNVSSKIVI